MIDYRKKYNYLIKALKAYRFVTYGRFGLEDRHEVEETQDAAVAIEDLLCIVEQQAIEIERLKRDLSCERNLQKD
jgi:hypothetical protein